MNHLRRRILIAAAAAALALPAAAQPQARAKMLVTADWVKAHIADPNLVILQVGDDKDYDAGHLAGARRLAMEGLSPAQPGPNGLVLEMPAPEALRAQLMALGVTDKSRIVVYASQNHIPGATRVIFTLDDIGLGDRASLMDGGLAEWRRLGYPVTTEAPVIRTGALAPVAFRAKVVDAAFVQSHLNAPGYSIVDARAGVFYDGVQPGMGGVKGHLPGAKSVPFTSVTTPAETYKPADQLAAGFTAAGVKPGDHLIVYCHVGWQATAVIFAARSLGIDAVLYDGSFQDWAQRKLPVETAAAR
jgi:thiosulfate/3-mercaptopyruvate sulfurtransferase